MAIAEIKWKLVKDTYLFDTTTCYLSENGNHMFYRGKEKRIEILIDDLNELVRKGCAMWLKLGEYKKIYNKTYYKHNKDKLLEDNKNYREQNHDRYIQYQRNYSKQYGKINREKYHDNIVKLNNAYVNQLCFDPILKNYCTYNQLRYRKNYGKNKKYENVKLSNCIIK